MKAIPIVFAFDNNLAMPAAVCLYSLLVNAAEGTIYHIHILHSGNETLDTSYIERVIADFTRHKISYISVGTAFENAFEIRGITTPAYYRLLIPELLPEYDKVIYSDVDVIFRNDLSGIYNSYPLDNLYIAGVNNLAHLDGDLGRHYGDTLHLDKSKIICSGFLLMNSGKIADDGLIEKFKERASRQYKFQDQDILNIVCAGRIGQLPPAMSVLTYIAYMANHKRSELRQLWSDAEIEEALRNGNIHYNGRKPWQGYCPNLDIWWEYYRKSPIFDEKFYFDFFYGKLHELDRLPLLKRIKILARYFVYGKK